MTPPRYPNYKRSGIEWLGEVPDHWPIDRLKWSIKTAKNGIWGEEAQGNQNDIACVRVADFDRTELCVRLSDPTVRNVAPKDLVDRILKRGDLLLEKSGGGENQPVGCVVLYNDDRSAICSNFIARLEPASDMNSSYWRYVHAAAYSIRLTTCSINQTSGIQNFDQSRYFDEPVAFPPSEEQECIAEFLDRETEKIDRVIEEQRRLIELLKEKRQAVISHAITKGLNPDAPMKRSGIEWIGDIPAHWECGPFKRFASVIDCKHHTVTFLDEGLPVVSIRELEGDKIDLSDAKLTSEEEWRFLREGRIPRPGDLIICRNASVGAIGEVLAGMDFCMGQDVCLIRPHEPDGFYHYALSSGVVRAQIEALLIGATIRRMNVQAVRNLTIVLPPRSERASIVRRLNELTRDIDALTAVAKAAVELLQERRSALISAAVTGKIDVRPAVPECVA